MPTSRPPEEIKEQIESLQQELKLSLLERAKILVWDDKHNPQHETIGFFNITKAKTILRLLADGEKLLLIHAAGKRDGYIVYMNPQRNRFFIDHEDDLINDRNIEKFIIWGSGMWYKINKEYYDEIQNL